MLPPGTMDKGQELNLREVSECCWLTGEDIDSLSLAYRSDCSGLTEILMFFFQKQV